MSISEAFHDYFHGTDTKVDFSVQDADRMLEFIRLDHPQQSIFDLLGDDLPKGYMSFEQLMRRYGKWGYRIVDFKLNIDSEEVIHYEMNPSELILPILLKHAEKEDVLIKETGVYFKKGVKRLLRDVEKEMISMILGKFKEATDAGS
jgi:hypothetical protein